MLVVKSIPFVLAFNNYNSLDKEKKMLTLYVFFFKIYAVHIRGFLCKKLKKIGKYIYKKIRKCTSLRGYKKIYLKFYVYVRVV